MPGDIGNNFTHIGDGFPADMEIRDRLGDFDSRHLMTPRTCIGGHFRAVHPPAAAPSPVPWLAAGTVLAGVVTEIVRRKPQGTGPG